MGEESRDRDERRQHDREPWPQPREQPEGLRADEEDPEVVRGEREAANHAPPRQPATVATEREPEGEYRRRPEEREQRVRARLLRVPHEERIRGDEGSGDEACSPGYENRPGSVRDRDRRGARERGERPQADLAEPEDRAPEPCDDVVEVRRRLGPRDLAEGAAEAAIEQRGGDELVEPEALPVESREAEHGAEQGESDDRPVPHRGGTHQPADSRAGPRSPASAARAVTMKSG